MNSSVIYAPFLVLGMAIVISVFSPLIFIYLRHQVRLQRLRILDQFERTFSIEARDDPTSGVQYRYNRYGHAPSFEYIREKYIEDLLEEPRALQRRGNLQNIRWWEIRSSWSLFLAAIPFIVLTTAGLCVLFACLGPNGMVQELFAAMGLRRDCMPLFLVGGLHPVPPHAIDDVLTVAGFAFLGAYVFSLGVMARAVSTFDLSPLTIVRLAINIVTGVAGVVVAYRAFPDLGGLTPEAFDKAISTLPYAFAFVAGMVPDIIINKVIGEVQNLDGAKTFDNGVLAATKSTSPEVIDGIDFFVRFRLQQANIFEVQHLAVANPIMLFVETPYGIYQCIDWVAQAQLCTIVGPDRFLAMRSFNIRTIFDVERALLSEYTTSQLRRLVATLMFSAPSAPPASAWAFWGLDKPGQRGTVGSAAFGEYIAKLLTEPPTGADGAPIDDNPDQTIKHLGRIITDDLHVHRLRDVWLLIQSRLGAGDALPDSEAP